jgi:hypothetical protein
LARSLSPTGSSGDGGITDRDVCVGHDVRMSDDRPQVPYSQLVTGFVTDDIDPGDTIVSIFSLVKIRDSDGDIQWAARSGGEEMSSEELLGALSGLTASVRRDLADEWEW